MRSSTRIAIDISKFSSPSSSQSPTLLCQRQADSRFTRQNPLPTPLSPRLRSAYQPLQFIQAIYHLLLHHYLLEFPLRLLLNPAYDLLPYDLKGIFRVPCRCGKAGCEIGVGASMYGMRESGHENVAKGRGAGPRCERRGWWGRWGGRAVLGCGGHCVNGYQL